MAYIRLTAQAQNELDAIIEYYERVVAINFAEVFEEKVIEAIRPLERFPRMGRVVPEINDQAIREVLYRNFRIVYVVDRDNRVVTVQGPASPGLSIDGLRFRRGIFFGCGVP